MCESIFFVNFSSSCPMVQTIFGLINHFVPFPALLWLLPMRWKASLIAVAFGTINRMSRNRRVPYCAHKAALSLLDPYCIYNITHFNTAMNKVSEIIHYYPQFVRRNMEPIWWGVDYLVVEKGKYNRAYFNIDLGF